MNIDFGLQKIVSAIAYETYDRNTIMKADVESLFDAKSALLDNAIDMVSLLNLNNHVNDFSIKTDKDSYMYGDAKAISKISG